MSDQLNLWCPFHNNFFFLNHKSNTSIGFWYRKVLRSYVVHEVRCTQDPHKICYITLVRRSWKEFYIICLLGFSAYFTLSIFLCLRYLLFCFSQSIVSVLLFFLLFFLLYRWTGLYKSSRSHWIKGILNYSKHKSSWEVWVPRKPLYLLPCYYFSNHRERNRGVRTTLVSELGYGTTRGSAGEQRDLSSL